MLDFFRRKHFIFYMCYRKRLLTKYCATVLLHMYQHSVVQNIPVGTILIHDITLVLDGYLDRIWYGKCSKVIYSTGHNVLYKGYAIRQIEHLHVQVAHQAFSISMNVRFTSTLSVFCLLCSGGFAWSCVQPHAGMNTRLSEQTRVQTRTEINIRPSERTSELVSK